MVIKKKPANKKNPQRKQHRKRIQLAESAPIRVVDRGYRDWEHASQFYVWDLYVGNDRVEIEYDTTTRYSPWRVIWEGAVDFEGNKKEMLSRYPEFRRLLEDY
jgi:hypothetical protein